MYYIQYIESVLTHEQEGDDGVEGDGRAHHRKYSGEGLHHWAAAPSLGADADQHSQGRPGPPEVPYRPCRPLVVHFKVLCVYVCTYVCMYYVYMSFPQMRHCSNICVCMYTYG